MKRLNLAVMMIAGLSLAASVAYGQMSTEVDVRLTGEGRSINGASRLNPSNDLLNLNRGAGTEETRLTLSDRFEGGNARWLFKGYSFYASEREGQRNVNRIDELFVDWKRDHWFFSVGKRRVNWGTALAFNPVNVVVPARDPLNPKLETEGQPLAWASYNRGGVTADLFLTRNFDRSWHSDLTRWGGRVGVVAGQWDLAAYYFDGQAYRATSTTTAGARPYERMLGVSASGNLVPGVTLYTEAAEFSHTYRGTYDAAGTRRLEDRQNIQAVVGSFIVLPPESPLSFLRGSANLTLEAYYNGSGYSQSARRSYFEALDRALGAGDPSVLADYRFTGMSRTYLLATYSNAFKERYTTDISALVSADRSYSLQTQLQYNVSDYYGVRFKWLGNHGGRSTEFGNAPLSNIAEVALLINF